MKSIEEKAKAYDKALEKIHQFIDGYCSREISKEKLEDIFPELKESEYEKTRKEILDYIIKSSESCYDVQQYGKEKFEKWIAWLEKQGEQKHIDKIEPKFKIGDWILIYNPCQIECIDNYGNYIVRYCDMEETTILPRDFCNSHFHLWSIADANDGDVLVDVYGNIGIYKKCGDYDWTSYCSLGCNGGFQNFLVTHDNDKTHPATKVQRDTLERAIANAGYRWDAEKKEIYFNKKGGE